MIIKTKKFCNLFLKTIIFFLITINISKLKANEHYNFSLAIKSAFENSSKIKSSYYIFLAKEKLLNGSNHTKDWDSSFTSSLNLNNKMYDNEGSYLSDETFVNTLKLSKKLIDGGIAYNQYLIASGNLKIEKNNLLNTKQNVIVDTIKSYIELYKSQKSLELREKSVNKFNRLVNSSKLKLKAGAITPTTVAEAEASLARAKYQFVKAKSEVNNFRSKFFSIVGEDFDIKNLNLPEVFIDLPNNEKEALSISFKNNPVILNAKIKKKIAISKRNKQISSNKPTLEFDIQYKNSESTTTSSANDFQSYGTTLLFKAPLFYKRSEKYSILSLNDDYQAVIEEQKEANRYIKLQVLSKYNDYKNSFLNTEAAMKELSAAKLALDGIKKEEEFGMRTLLDVLDYEVKVINSELNLISSKSNEVLQKYELKKVLGTLTIKDIVKDYEIKYNEDNNFNLPNVFEIDFK